MNRKLLFMDKKDHQQQGGNKRKKKGTKRKTKCDEKELSNNIESIEDVVCQYNEEVENMDETKKTFKELKDELIDNLAKIYERYKDPDLILNKKKKKR